MRRFVGDVLYDVGHEALCTFTYLPWIVGVLILSTGWMSPYWQVESEKVSGLWTWRDSTTWGFVVWNAYRTDLIRWVQVYEGLGFLLSSLSVISSLTAVCVTEQSVINFYKLLASACSMFDGPLILAGCIVFWVQLEGGHTGPSFWLTLIAGLLHVPRGMVGMNVVWKMLSQQREQGLHEN
ncbi:hypothetical protein C0Q70_02828 [Pomacea canaliculata]|uniref:Uncharacterized protein n=2 Tax=Pomacea canaliculata TaxID=400727 RepID=A0A2T7PR09_POMCA|nr:hypothetical protein C0Q70_02828 [Pomacea canaliculata]